MGRKRRGGGRPFGEDSIRQSSNKNDSRLTINTFEDVPDSEDEFHIQRDEIRLNEGPAAKKSRRLQEREADLELSDEEILAISDDDEDIEDITDEEAGEQEVSPAQDAVSQQQKPQAKRSRLGKPVQDSEDEAEAVQEDEVDERWGTSRKDYYNADVNETEQDALAEEAEALRLQQKQMQGMTDADYGLDTMDWGSDQTSADAGRGSRVVTEVLPRPQITEAMGAEERMSILRVQYPEFEPLAKEFVDLQEVFASLQQRSERLHTNRNSDYSMPALALKQRALGAYLSAISMYFVLLTSASRSSEGIQEPMPPEQLQNHAIIGILVECRELWGKVQGLPELEIATDRNHHKVNGHTAKEVTSEPKSSNGVLKAVAVNDSTVKKRKVRKSKAQKALEDRIGEDDARRKAQMDATEASLVDLSGLALKPRSSLKSTSKNIPTGSDQDSDFGEQTSLTAAELAEKARRKKTLRFYTSQIAQKSNKRTAAGRDAGGDDDLPYRERWKEKQARLQAEAEKRGKRATLPDTEQDGSEISADDAIDSSRNRPEIPDAQDDDEYYDIVAARAMSKKADKAARAAGNGTITRITDDAGLDEDGRRNISYEIEKNKGLMNRRKKEQRNPRVKKKLKYAEKKKKLASMKPVYKGGEGRGGYGGELTGIKKGLVKGVKLS